MNDVQPKFCTACGSPRVPDAAFCINCGHRFPDLTAEPRSPHIAPAMNPEPVQPSAAGGDQPETQSAAAEQASPVATDAPVTVPSKPSGANRAGLWIAIGAAVIAAIVAVAVTVWLLNGNADTVPPAEQSPPTQGPTATSDQLPTESASEPTSQDYADITTDIPPVADTVSLDPCDGQPFPFDYALSRAPEPPGPNSDTAIAVRNVQEILRSLGYTGESRTNVIEADGWYGRHTAFAVKQFQRDNGIDPVGTVFRETWEALGQQC